jgi:hypothetical protein
VWEKIVAPSNAQIGAANPAAASIRTLGRADGSGAVLGRCNYSEADLTVAPTAVALHDRRFGDAAVGCLLL